MGITYVSEIDPICALQACMEGFIVATMGEAIAAGVDIVITTTGNKDIITLEHGAKMKNNCIVGNIGHFDNEIQMEKLEAATKRLNIKPQVDKFIFPDGHGVIILAEGRLLNLAAPRATRRSSCPTRSPTRRSRSWRSAASTMRPARTRRRASTRTRCTCCRRSSTRRSRACTLASWAPT